MRYCFRSGRFRPNPRTKHISIPPRHMTTSYIPDFNVISQHYRYKNTTSHTIGIQLPEYNTTAEDIRLSIGYKQMPSGKGKTHHSAGIHRTSHRRVSAKSSRRRVVELHRSPR